MTKTARYAMVLLAVASTALGVAVARDQWALAAVALMLLSSAVRKLGSRDA